jgi:hypothetical protein
MLVPFIGILSKLKKKMAETDDPKIDSIHSFAQRSPDFDLSLLEEMVLTIS